MTFPAGTTFTSPEGVVYRATNEFVLPPAHETEFEGGATVHASEVVVWAEAVQEGASAVSTVPGQYTVGGLDGVHFVIDTSRNGSGPLAPDGQGTEW